MIIELYKTYSFDFSDKVSFGDLPKELIYEMCRDGRVASKFLENYAPLWFPELTFEDSTGYDHIRKSDGRKFDMKSFTKGGCVYAPSNMVGKGRSIDEVVLHEHANSIDYLLCDITEFPIVRVRAVEGSYLVKNYPSGKIPVKDRGIIF